MSARELGVVEKNGARRDTLDKGVDRLVALGRALSDPIRVRMLSMMADGRSCCDFSDSGVPVVEGEEGICVCEFEEHFGMGQSKVSYHMKKLKDAGLAHEERRGKWSFYTLDQEAAGQLLGEAADRLLPSPENRSVAGGCRRGRGSGQGPVPEHTQLREEPDGRGSAAPSIRRSQILHRPIICVCT